MAKEDYGQLAKEVVAAVGGKENIVRVSNCMTRLRFVLKDDTIPNKDEVSKIKGVKGVIHANRGIVGYQQVAYPDKFNTCQ